jgi:hypothetical protein
MNSAFIGDLLSRKKATVAAWDNFDRQKAVSRGLVSAP